MIKYYMFWSDYDGEREEEFVKKEEVVKRFNELITEYEDRDYGFVKPRIIQGREIEMEAIELVRYRIKKD